MGSVFGFAPSLVREHLLLEDHSWVGACSAMDSSFQYYQATGLEIRAFKAGLDEADNRLIKLSTTIVLANVTIPELHLYYLSSYTHIYSDFLALSRSSPDEHLPAIHTY